MRQHDKKERGEEDQLLIWNTIKTWNWLLVKINCGEIVNMKLRNCLVRNQGTATIFVSTV